MEYELLKCASNVQCYITQFNYANPLFSSSSCVTVNVGCTSHFSLCVCGLVHRVLYYQRRWVKLDVDYLRYFDNDKVTTNMDSNAITSAH